MRVLLAFDKFKDALSSTEACAIAARALRASHPEWELDLCPLTDGGEGFCEILTRAADGECETHRVAGPRGTPVSAALGWVGVDQIPADARRLLRLDAADAASCGPIHAPPRVAIIEMALAAGLALLPPDQRDIWATSTIGVGELIRAASERGAAAILLGIGGSATNDLGLGALAALGFEFQSAQNARVTPPVPARWESIARISGRPVALPPIHIACDVNNPLLGPRGAAAVYGAQKGLRAADRPRLENAAARLALLLCHHCRQPDSLMDMPGAGAAGGISFGLMAAAGARVLSGFELVSAWLALERRLAAADLVLTGEGRFDQSSLEGKGPGTIARWALQRGKRVEVFAGEVATATLPSGLSARAITSPNTPRAQALAHAAENLDQAIRCIFVS